LAGKVDGVVLPSRKKRKQVAEQDAKDNLAKADNQEPEVGKKQKKEREVQP
jgi:hypothetical protein